MTGHARTLALLLVALAFGCKRGEPPGASRSAPGPVSSQPSPWLQRSAAAPASAATAPTAAAAPPALSASEDAGAPIDWKNKARPELSGADLEARGRALLSAVSKDDPELAREFFFPREPFKPLKDVTEPDRYWVQLWGLYKRDIRELHRKRRDWTDVRFESLTLGTQPKWVKPGEEYNKIGYYRTFGARLKYTVGGSGAHLDISTLISWNGQWHVTHLLPIKKAAQ